MRDYLLNKIFTVPYLDRFIYEPDDRTFFELSQDFLPLENMTYGACIHELYQYMSFTYRNEYYFKNTLFNQLMVKNHNIYNTTAFTEFPIAGSKADFVMINGKGIVYEIKTDLDNFQRLENQIIDYYKAFPYVNVVVSRANYLKVKDLLEESPVGIMVLYPSNNLLSKKKAIYCDKYLTNDAMLGVLRKKEIEKIILKYMQKLPDVNDFYYYRECKKWIQKLDKNILHQEMITCLKQRNLGNKKAESFENVPYELRLYAYLSKVSIEMIQLFYKKKMEVSNVLSIS